MHSKIFRMKRAIAVCAVLGGCSTAHVGAPLTQSLGGNAPEDRGEFWYQLAKQPIASNDDAFHALLLYLDGKDDNDNYASRVRALQSRQMLSANFNGTADEAVDRGTLAVALDRMLNIQGGLTMRLLGPSPRYALRAAQERGLFPPSSINQGITGGEFVGVMQKAEEFEHGNPSDYPAAFLPEDHDKVTIATPPSPIAATNAVVLGADPLQPPLYLDEDPTTLPAVAAAAGNQSVHLKAIVTGIQGDLVEIRPSATAAWKLARPGMVLREGTEIRTGPKSAIRFLIPAEEAFCLDSEGSITLQQAVIDAKKAKTRIDLDHGRLREDLTHTAPVQIEEAGIEHDTIIKSANSALALRGTKVSLFEQPSFDPVAVSLTGQAFFTNTAGMRVPFGGRSHVIIVGNQTSPAQQADARSSSVAGGDIARLEFETRELSIVTQRGGFQRGDVIVGDLFVSDFKTLPGALDFVLTWNGGASHALNDLNLAVFSPLDPHNTTTPGATADYVANPPFTVSLTPNSPASKAIRASTYPDKSRSGGEISTNSVGPAGLELAFWPKGYPVGNYGIVVYDLVDAKTPPATTTNPVPFTVTEYQNGVTKEKYNGSVGLLQTSPYVVFPVPATSSSALVSAQQKTKISSSNPLARFVHIKG